MSWGVKYSWHEPVGIFDRKQDAEVLARQMREANRQAGLTGSVKVIKTQPRPNPSKVERAVASQKAAVRRRVAVALAKYLKQQNPGVKLAGAQIEHLKGGVLKITPIKMNPRSVRAHRIVFSKWSNPRRQNLDGYNAWDYLGGNPHQLFNSRAEAASWLRAHHKGKDQYGVNAIFKVVKGNY